MSEVLAKAEVVEIRAPSNDDIGAQCAQPVVKMDVPGTGTNDGDGDTGYGRGFNGDIGTLNCGDRSTGNGGRRQGERNIKT